MLIIAHRGYSARHPENGTAAFEAAIAAGADFIETDVRLTRDGVAVCWHDPDLERLAGRAEAIADLTHEALAALLAEHGRSILELDAVLALASGRARVMLDVKVRTDEMAAAILAALDARNLRADAVYGVREPAQYPALRRAAPDLALLAMPSDPELLPDFVREGVTAVRLWEHEVTPARIARIRAARCDVWVTAGLKAEGEAPGEITAARLAKLHALGVNAVLVNDPQRAAIAVGACDAERHRSMPT
jgi:glycerophosphoryl diester phosphodiesterase